MASARTEDYWTRIKYAIGGPTVIFLLTVGAFATLPSEVDGGEIGFSNYPIQYAFVLLFFMSLLVGSLVLWHSIYRDKQELSKDFSTVTTRHWLTIGVLFYITAGLYPLWYALSRLGTTANESSSDVGVVTPSDGNPPAPRRPATKPDGGSLAADARGDALTDASLTGDTGGILALEFLHHEPMEFYLDSGEQPHYLFENVASGVTVGSETVKAGWTDSYRNTLLITSRGVHFFVGRAEGDFHAFEPYRSIETVRVNTGLLSNKFSIRAGNTVYRMPFQADSDDPEEARAYMLKQMRSVSNSSHGKKSSGASDPSAATQPRTPSSGKATHPGGRNSTDRIKRQIEEANSARARAENYRDAGEFDRALSLLADAQETYKRALSAAQNAEAIDAEIVELKLSTLAEEHTNTLHQRATEAIESYRARLGRAKRLAEDGKTSQARDVLEKLASELESASARVSKNGFGDLQTSLSRLESRSQKLLRRVSHQPKAEPSPNMIASPPELTVEYGSLHQKHQIGSGGNARVTRAACPTPDGQVTIALKEPQMSGTLSTGRVDRMLSEAETWSKLDDQRYIVTVIDFGAEPVPWIAMEFMDGGSLDERASGMAIPQALWTAIAITQGVRHAHRRGVAHLDLKPQNILFQQVVDAWDVPKVADWGLSKHLLDQTAATDGLSPTYAAPEQYEKGRGPTDDITDIYQLGAVFYELFTGQQPFTGSTQMVRQQVLSQEPTPPEQIVKLPNGLNDLLLTALEKDRSDRYRAIEYLEDALRDVYDGL